MCEPSHLSLLFLQAKCVYSDVTHDPFQYRVIVFTSQDATESAVTDSRGNYKTN